VNDRLSGEHRRHRTSLCRTRTLSQCGFLSSSRQEDTTFASYHLIEALESANGDDGLLLLFTFTVRTRLRCWLNAITTMMAGNS